VVGHTSSSWQVPSEDPLLNGFFGAEYSLGMQNGSDPRFLQGIATLKHFDANQLEGDWPGPSSVCTGGVCTRHTINASISTYDWASSYLPAFQRSVVQGGAQAVMCSCACVVY
jgi:beta-glucosidase